MKKRLLSIILAILMILPVVAMTGCKKEDNVVVLTSSDANPLTITLYTIVGDETSDDTIKLVENRINEITQFKFNTHIILRALTAEEYNEKVAEDLVAAEKAFKSKDKKSKKNKETEKAKPETYKNGETKHVTVKKAEAEYPAEEGKQVDIFLINSLDMYNNCINDGSIQAVSAEFLPGAGSDILTKYINPTLMSSMSRTHYSLTSYAVPNNRLVDNFEYILLDKGLVDKYGFNYEEVSSLSELKPFIASASGEAGYTTVLDTYGLEPLVQTLDGVLGVYTGTGLISDSQLAPDCIYNDEAYCEEYAMLKDYRANGTIVSATPEEFTDETKAACVFLEGNTYTPEKYADKYYVCTYKKPTATNENVFNAIYAVSSYTKNLQRCMDIINYMQTDVEFVNVMRYGVEGTHYTKDEFDFVTLLNHDYVIDPEYAGNMFLQYQNNEMSEYELEISNDNWALAKKNNLELVWGPYLGFSHATTDVLAFTFNPKRLDSEYKNSDEYTISDITGRVTSISAEYEEQIASLTGTALVTKMKELGAGFEDDEIIDLALSNNYRESVFARYMQWYTDNHPENPEEE